MCKVVVNTTCTVMHMYAMNKIRKSALGAISVKAIADSENYF